MSNSAKNLSISATQFPQKRATASVAILCGFAGDYGIPLARCLQGTGIEAGALTDPDAEITAGQELALMANILDEIDDAEGLGLEVGARYRITTAGIWGLAVLASKTVAEAVSVGMSCAGLTYVCTHLGYDEATSELSFGDWDLPERLRRFVLERDTVAALAIWAEGMNRPVDLYRLDLRLPTPAQPEKFEAAFGRMPRFGAERTVMGFDPAISEEAMPQASPLTAQVSEQYCRQLLQRRHAWTGVSGRVRDLILRDPRTPLSQDAAAKVLGVSVRTLRRQLDDESTAFRTVVAQTYQHLAEELLRGGFSVDQVAARLGYAEATSFTHAFTRWTGIAPGRWARENSVR